MNVEKKLKNLITYAWFAVILAGICVALAEITYPPLFYGLAVFIGLTALLCGFVFSGVSVLAYQAGLLKEPEKFIKKVLND